MRNVGYAPTGSGGGFHWQAYFHQYQNLRPGSVLPTPPKPNVTPAANAGGGATYPQSQGGTGGGGSAGGNDVGFFEGLFGFGKSVVNSIQDGLASLIRIPLDMAYGNFSAELDISRARREWATEQLANPNSDWGAAINAYQHPLQGMDATINLLTETMLATAGNIGNVGLAERVFVGGMAREVTATPAMAGFFWFMRKKAPKWKVSLGIEDHLDDFSRRHGADSWKVWAKEDPMQWKGKFYEVMNDPNAEVLFNLDGVDVWGGVTRASRNAGGATDWELLQIYSNKDWWSRIKWIKDGKAVPNPFE